MTATELQAHPYFDLCKAAEKTFVLTYLTTGGDMARSIRTAYPKVKSVPHKALSLQRNDIVSALLAYIDGEEMPTKEAMIRLLWKTMRNNSSNPFVVVNGSKIITELEGYGVKPDPKQQAKERAERLDKLRDRNNNAIT